jgi:hypothetical protein
VRQHVLLAENIVQSQGKCPGGGGLGRSSSSRGEVPLLGSSSSWS